MSDIVLKLSKLERGNFPHLLPFPPLTPSLGSQPNTATASSSLSQPRQLKLEIPLFTSENVHSWIFQIKHFFTYHAIPDEHKVLGSFNGTIGSP